MKITALETIRLAEFANLLWLRVHTSEGLVGLGETFFCPATIEAYVHEAVAPKLLGRDPLQIDKISKDLTGYLGFRSTGVEMRAASALDIALWDLLGKVTGQPIAQLLGGFSRDKIRTYNTCAGTAYMRENLGQRTDNWGLTANDRQYDDLNAFLERADELAEDLLAERITAMKIWPFDFAAEANDGVDISNAEMKRALEPFEKIRHAVGDRMEIMVEFHSLWQLLPAIRIARALAPFDTKWQSTTGPVQSCGATGRCRLLSHLVSRSYDRAAEGGERFRHGSAGSGSRPRTCPGSGGPVQCNGPNFQSVLKARQDDRYAEP
jgi:L-alanine-DL-glutamate epimerase-like enolase superfamily enzyme